MPLVQDTKLKDIIVNQKLAQEGNFQFNYQAGGIQIISIQIHETAGNAVTGGLRIGTSAGATDVVVAQAVGANALFVLTDVAVVKKTFPFVPFDLYVEAVTDWNGAVINCTLTIGPVA
jgi:hypothetical protein